MVYEIPCESVTANRKDKILAWIIHESVHRGDRRSNVLPGPCSKTAQKLWVRCVAVDGAHTRNPCPKRCRLRPNDTVLPYECRRKSLKTYEPES